MGGFGLREIDVHAMRRLWLRGGFPRSFLARSDVESGAWRRDFIRTFLERDLRTFGIDISARALRRLWTMLAHYHGQVWNASEIGRSLGEAHTWAKRIQRSGGMRTCWWARWSFASCNRGLRTLAGVKSKSPKLHIRDSGILHSLLGAESSNALESHPKLSASWERFVIEQVLNVTGIRDAYYWGTQSGRNSTCS
jgi:predicted AAA+ superfamily ATPase